MYLESRYVVDFRPRLEVLGGKFIDCVYAKISRDKLFPQLYVFTGDLWGVGFKLFELVW